MNWARVENIVLYLIFAAILFAFDGWAVAWAVVPLLFVNYKGDK